MERREHRMRACACMRVHVAACPPTSSPKVTGCACTLLHDTMMCVHMHPDVELFKRGRESYTGGYHDLEVSGSGVPGSGGPWIWRSPDLRGSRMGSMI